MEPSVLLLTAASDCLKKCEAITEKNPIPWTNVFLESMDTTRVAVAQFPSELRLEADRFPSISCPLLQEFYFIHALREEQIRQEHFFKLHIKQLEAELVQLGQEQVLDEDGRSEDGDGFSSEGASPLALAPPAQSPDPSEEPSLKDSGDGEREDSLPPPSLPSAPESPTDPKDNRPLRPEDTVTSESAVIQPPVEELIEPSPGQPTSLEMLQRTTQEVLTKASKNLLINSLILDDDVKLSSQDGEGGKENLFRHRCRYCGKVFGSDSALQIHIRSHTGERPFKCNICGNRFTTKGNLKVHFQRHSTKYPHIKMNPNPVPEHLDRFYPPLVPQESGKAATPPPPQSPSSLLISTPVFSSALDPLYAPFRSIEKVQPKKSPPFEGRDPKPPTPRELFAMALAPKEPPSPMDTSDEALDLTQGLREGENDSEDNEPRCPSSSASPSPPAGPPFPLISPERTLPGRTGLPPSLSLLIPSSTPSTPRKPQIPLEMVTPPLRTPPLAFPLALRLSPGLRGPPRGNTTCNICFKVFACHSALEIHYRSHTKEKPFKCSICDRGFSTKRCHYNHALPCIFKQGNMKQHMLTHKKDENTPLGSSWPGAPSSSAFPCKEERSESSSSAPGSPEGSSRSQSAMDTPYAEGDEGGNASSDGGGAGGSGTPGFSRPISAPDIKPPASQDPDPPQGPLPERPPGYPKHMCHVCKKNFSSGSALQIHMRTHTGDRPFKCHVCARAFTTKGNLKVHMGIHTGYSGAPRRGRRMSFDIPLHPLGKDFPGGSKDKSPGTPGTHHDILRPNPDLLRPNPDLLRPNPDMSHWAMPPSRAVSFVLPLFNGFGTKASSVIAEGNRETTEESSSPPSPPKKEEDRESPRKTDGPPKKTDDPPRKTDGPPSDGEDRKDASTATPAPSKDWAPGSPSTRPPQPPNASYFPSTRPGIKREVMV
ncbi:unnamed protein product [Cyprideis torosa]|uniref:Homeotic protein spalt-major n=1 Tax=Cyprideis torosa TaxID=163714 RepID=A0A7R8ZGU9_9CRUS|nr:unnamed protein product [Cyprideis torosa]CAG0882225.1 unnamed protein product [Cyprideis torosa]